MSRYTIMMEGKGKVHKIDARLHMVRYAQREGIREAARVFGASRNTVRLWLRRYEREGISGLEDKRKGPKNIPHKTPKEEEERIIAAKKKVPCYGAGKLKEAFGLRASVGAIGRILRERGLTRKPKKKYKKKRDLREVKARYEALTHHQEDIKYLSDIPHYWPQMRRHKLPLYQYTIRDTKSGAIFLGFGSEISEVYASLFTERYIEYLREYGIEAKEVTIQTDNGVEFSGTRRKRSSQGFTYVVEERLQAKHTFIPPGCKNANADVESSHALIEREFYDLEEFSSKEDFLEKVTTYQNYFNFARPNSYKGNKTPWDIVKEDRPGISPEVLLFPPVFLDDYFREKFLGIDRVGQKIPVDVVF